MSNTHPMIKREAKAQIVFKHWLQSGAWTHGPAVFELKYTDGESIAFSSVKDHQIRSLIAADFGLYYKIPDDSIGQKPFDCFYLIGVPGYVVLFFGRNFYIIPAAKFQELSETSARRSMTEEMAQQSALISEHY